MLDIKYVIGEDWEGLYIRNVLVDEGHRIRFDDGFKFICNHINYVKGVESIQFSIYGIDQDWLETVAVDVYTFQCGDMGAANLMKFDGNIGAYDGGFVISKE